MLFPSFNGLHDLVNACSKYAELYCIVFNVSKSKDMIFHEPYSKNFLPKLYIAGNPINFSNSVKYLGFHLNQSLTKDELHFCILQEISCKVIFQCV